MTVDLPERNSVPKAGYRRYKSMGPAEITENHCALPAGMRWLEERKLHHLWPALVLLWADSTQDFCGLGGVSPAQFSLKLRRPAYSPISTTQRLFILYITLLDISQEVSTGHRTALNFWQNQQVFFALSKLI